MLSRVNKKPKILGILERMKNSIHGVFGAKNGCYCQEIKVKIQDTKILFNKTFFKTFKKNNGLIF